MSDTTRNLINGVLTGLLMLACLVFGIQHGKSLGELHAIAEYELGYNTGWKEALYQRPVSEELEMVCLGLWIASLPERKGTEL